ncbi:hypothetical protein H4R35_001379 [Dimargaris xerosporica]|nr:hypothetical protein H4R35_001379 [Dimargaris xerosporica]
MAIEYSDHQFQRIRPILYLSTTGAYAVFVLLTTVFYFRRAVGLDNRPKLLLLINILSSLCLCITIGLTNGLRSDMPCSVNLWCYYFFGTLWWVSFLARTIHLSFLSQSSRAKLHVQELTSDGPDPAHYLDSTTVLAPQDERPNYIMDFLTRRFTWIRLKYFMSERTMLYATITCELVVLIYCLVVQLVSPRFRPGSSHKTCGLEFEFYPLYGSLALLLVFVCPVILLCLWPLEDAFGIRRDMIITIAMAYVMLPLFFTMDSAILHPYAQYFGGSVFVMVGLAVIHIVTVVAPLVASFRARSKIGFGNTMADAHYHWEDMQRILASTLQAERLKAFASTCFNSELMLFLEDYQRLKKRIYPILCSGNRGSLKGQNKSSLSPRTCYGSPNAVPSSHPHASSRESQESAITFALRSVKYLRSSLRSMTYGADPYLMEYPSPASQTIAATLLPMGALDRDKETGAFSFNTPIPLECEVMARNFYRRYINPQSDLAIRFPVAVLESVQAAIQRDAIPINVFDESHQHVLYLLYRNVFPRYWEELVQ